MEGSIIFCQKNIPERSLSCHGDHKKEMHTNIKGQSDIVTQPTNILNKVYTVKKHLFC
jgi:hypothetical protein